MQNATGGLEQRSFAARMASVFTSAVIAAIGLWVGLWAVGEELNVDAVEALVLIIVLLVAEAVTQPILRSLAGRGGALLALAIGLVGQLVVAGAAAYFVVGVEIRDLGRVALVLGVMALVMAIGRWLLGASDEAYVVGYALRHRRRRIGEEGATKGLVIVQLDGVSAPVLRKAMAAGQAPNIQSWIASGSHTLRDWWVPVPSTTPASQAGILHASESEVPGFRWWDRELNKLMVSNRPADAAIVESRMHGNGLLCDGGVAISTAFTGGAKDCFLVFSRATQRHGLGSGASYIPLFASPFLLPRTLVLTVGEMVKELWQARRQRVRNVRPRIKRKWSYVALRGLTNVFLRTTNLILVTDAMTRGAPIVFVDFVDYDEIAHHAGPERPESMRSLEGLDAVLGELARAAGQVHTDYEFVVWSDHGQSLGQTFRQKHGFTLADRVEQLMSDDVVRSVESANGDDWGPLNTLIASSMGKRQSVELGPDKEDHASADDMPEVIVVGGGNLGMVWFPEFASRPTLTQLESRWPELVSGLASTEGIAVVMVATDYDETLVIGPAGIRNLGSGAVEGLDPLIDFGPRSAADLNHLSSNRHCGDLVVLSTVDELGMVHAFEEQVGSHGGIGGQQNYGFFLHPQSFAVDRDLMVSDQEEGEIFASPVAIHQQIMRWRCE